MSSRLIFIHSLFDQTIYPSAEFESQYITDTPFDFAVVVAATFAFVVVVFFVYDLMVQQRNNKLIDSNAISNEIVSSLFPGQIRNQLLKSGIRAKEQPTLNHNNKSLKNFLLKGDVETGSSSQDGGNIEMDQPPLADLFLGTSVL